MSDVTAWVDRWWDEERGLLWNPPGSFEEHGMKPLSMHMVPQSAWYAVDCMMRGMTDRAERICRELTALQYDEPATIWHGTFARFAEWPHPGSHDRKAIEWFDYDPNWRQFIGTTFRLMELTWGLDLGAPIALAIEGEPPDRVSPRYSNIALMRAWLEADEGYAEAIVRLFDEFGAFEEYNSPTYYGIDLYALALWRVHPPTPKFKTWAEHIESTLWRDIARWYHPGLRQLCGPYSRAYGMDMSAHVALFGLWLPEPVVPDVSKPFEHSHDLTMAPVVELLGGGPSSLDHESGTVSQRISDERVATGWLGDDVILGGEEGGRAKAYGQYHPATAHWDGGWLRVRSPNRLDAMAFPKTLEVTGTELTIETEGTPFPGSVEETEDGLVITCR